MSVSNLAVKVGGWQFGSPAIGLDGTIYCTPAGDSFEQILKAYSPDGNKKWQHAFKKTSLSRPVISSDGTVYIAATHSQMEDPADIPKAALYAFDKAGNVLWDYSWPLRRSGSALIYDAHGFVYLILNGELHKISVTGEVLWTVATPGHEPTLLGADDEQVYLLAGNEWQNLLRAVSLEGKELWDVKAPFDAAEIQRQSRQRLVEKHGPERAARSVIRINYAPPNFENRAALTPAGNLIIANTDDHFYSVNPEGQINWRSNPEKSVSIGADNGTAAAYVTWKWGLYAVTENGKLLWKRQRHYTTVPVVGKKGQVYVAGMHEACAFDAHGDQLWVEPLQGIPGPYPALTHDGRFCVTTDWGYLYLLG